MKSRYEVYCRRHRKTYWLGFAATIEEAEAKVLAHYDKWPRRFNNICEVVDKESGEVTTY